MQVISGSYQNYQNGAVSNQLPERHSGEIVLGPGGNCESVDM